MKSLKSLLYVTVKIRRNSHGAYLAGASTILDVFGAASHRPKLGSGKDDWRAMGRDFSSVGDDMRAVLKSELKALGS